VGVSQRLRRERWITAPFVLQHKIGSAVRRASVLFTAGTVACVLLAAAVQGRAAFALGPPGSGLIPATGIGLRGLLVLPLFLLAIRRARVRRTAEAATVLASALLALCLLSALPAGVHAPGWFALPLLVLGVAVLRSAAAGMGFAFAGALAHGACAVFAPGSPAGESVARYALVVVAACLGAGMLGAFLATLLHSLGEVEHDHRRRVAATLRQLRRREGMLRHALRLNTVGALASSIVHQLRNCFQIALGEAAVGHDTPETEIVPRLRRIQAAIGDAAEVTGKLLVLAHPVFERSQRVDLGDRVRAIGADVRRFLPAAVELVVRIEPGPLPVRLDPFELEHAMINLILNSKQALPQDGGRIWLEVRREGAAAASLRVIDSGCGIAAEVLPHVFEPFFTTKRKGEGTGLGLAAVRDFADSCGARADVESVVGLGTTFTLTFPLLTDADRARPAPPSLATA
jgi:signal transduction histidine kinase